MNCRNILKCYLGIAVALLFAPQPKVMASTFSGCTAQLNTMVPDDIVALDAVDIFTNGSDVEKFGSQDQPLPINTPYKSSSSKEVLWKMRMSQSDYNSYLSQGSQSVTYAINFEPSRLKAEAVPNSIEQIGECPSDNSVLIRGKARLIFGELNVWGGGSYRPEFNVCFPGTSIGAGC